jgi:hypothetical protein
MRPDNSNLNKHAMIKAIALPEVDVTSITPAKLAEALQTIHESLTKLQRDVLSVLFLAPKNEILVDDCGQYSNVINALGKVGGRISREIGSMPSGGYHLYWVVTQKTNDEDGKRYWRMRPNFADALTIVGWK